MAISGPHGGEGGGVFADINITPLTDIFLVLLIIFMVTTSVTIESAAHVDLPNATNTAPENKGVIVTYTAQHELFVNSKDVPERELKSRCATRWPRWTRRSSCSRAIAKCCSATWCGSWASPNKPAPNKSQSRPSGSPVRNWKTTPPVVGVDRSPLRYCAWQEEK